MRQLEDLTGIKIGGRNINNIRYADDTALVDRIVQESDAKGLKINITKTQVMVVSKSDRSIPVSISIEGQVLKQVSSFKYLGKWITKEAKCETDIKSRIVQAKKTFDKTKHLIGNTSISTGLRMRFIKSYIWCTLLYGCESWTISKAMRKNLEAAEMWFLRRMLRISWVERVTNERVLQRAGCGRELLRSIRQRQLKFLGHAMRQSQLESVCLTGKLERKRGRGRPRMKFLDSLAIVQQLRSKTVMFPANFEDRLILIFLSSLDLELIKNARSPKIWAP